LENMPQEFRMMDSTQKTVLVIALVVGCLLVVAASVQGEEPTDAQKETQGVFRGELEVSLVNLFVTVVDRDGKPVAGLNREDVEVFDNGKLMEITNFAVIDHGKRVVSERNKKNVVDAVEGFVRHGLSEGDEFMVAANSGELRILQDFSSYEASLTATLEGVAGLEYGGSSVKRNKRLLKRTIHTTQFTRIQKAPFEGGVVIDEGYVRAIQFRVPVESLVLMPEGDAHTGVLVAAIAVLDGQGKTAEPRLMRLSITIPSERYQPDAIAARTLRLLMAPDTRRVAIGIRDEASGLASTAALDLNSLEPTAETTEN
jgi:hypothetical protein